MPLRSDPTVWYNLPGVVAAYQPIAAPGPLLARYNQAHGGDNRYKATDGVAPTWAGHTGWTFAAASTQYLDTGYAPTVAANVSPNVTVIVRYSNAGASDQWVVGGGTNTSDAMIGLLPRYDATRRGYWSGRVGLLSGISTTGVMAISGGYGYLNGILDAGMVAAPRVISGRSLYIGARNGAGTPGSYFTGSIQAVVICGCAVSAAEVWHASRQMAYCHVNPDWSAWGRKRRWYYAPSAAGFQAGWAAHSNAQIGTGVN